MPDWLRRLTSGSFERSAPFRLKQLLRPRVADCPVLAPDRNRRKPLRYEYARGDLNPQPLAPEAVSRDSQKADKILSLKPILCDSAALQNLSADCEKTRGIAVVISENLAETR
jgi:hypothetical protein